MLASFLIALRETLEIALIVGIVVALAHARLKTVWSAVIAAIIASGIFAFLFVRLAGGFEGRPEMLFEGVTMLIAAVLLASMVIWMLRHNARARITHAVKRDLDRDHSFGLFAFVFLAVLREGVEMVLFLAAAFTDGPGFVIGTVLGILLALAIGVGIYFASIRFDMKRFFAITSVLLLLFAAGLVSKSVGEFEEAGVIGPFVDDVWDANPALNPDGSYPFLHEEGWLGHLLHDLFGYDASPSLTQLLAYIVFLALVGLAWMHGQRLDRRVSV